MIDLEKKLIYRLSNILKQSILDMQLSKHNYLNIILHLQQQEYSG